VRVLAHGLGGRSDLPVPIWLAAYGGAAVLIISFIALGLFWKTPRLQGAAGGRALPEAFRRLVDSRPFRLALQAFGLIGLVALMAAGVLGPDTSSTNPAPTWFYVWFWVGLVPASVLLGPVWKLFNPLRLLARPLERFLNSGDEPPDVPARWQYIPAAVSLFAFVWVELVYDGSDLPNVVAGFVLLYSLIHVFAGANYGQKWFDTGDGFEVYSSLMARLAPLGRRDDGRLVVRDPLNGLDATASDRRLVPVIAVILGSTAFDGISRTRIWTDWSDNVSGAAYLLMGTAGLFGAIGVVWATFLVATRMSTPFLKERGTRDIEGLFIHSLIPISIGYTVAHYFSLFVFQGQAGYLLAPELVASDAVFTQTIDYTIVSPTTIAYVQVASIVLGHIMGVIAAHDRSVAVFEERNKTAAQYPLLAAMVLYTMSGIALLVGS
jgi:hypothetical protein